MARSSWLCKCGTRNDRLGGRKLCVSCGSRAPKKRVPKHQLALRDFTYQDYAALSLKLHGGEPGACGVCGRPQGEGRKHDRDHDHRTGKPRGLACSRCNRELLRHCTLEEARRVVAYLQRVEEHYGGAA